MPHLSRRKLDEKIKRELEDALEYVLSHSSQVELKSILFFLLSKTERLMIAKRLGTAALIKEGIPDSQIDQALKVTRFTVEKMNYKLSQHSEVFEILLKKLSQRQLKKGVKSLLVDLANYTVAAAGGRFPKKNHPY